MTYHYNRSKKDLFQTFSRNLSLYVPFIQDQFACPLCLETFERSSIKSILSKAHIVPKKAGRNEYTLTCAACNSRLGHRCDDALVESLRSGTEGFPTKGEIWVEDGKTGGPVSNAYISGKLPNEPYGIPEIKVDLPTEWTNPTVVDQLRDRIQRLTGDKNASISIRFRVPDQDRVNLSLLASAYLLLFHHLAYEFVFSPLGKSIRELLVGDLVPSQLIRTAPVALPIDCPAVHRYKADDRSGVAAYIPPLGRARFGTVVVLPELTARIEEAKTIAHLNGKAELLSCHEHLDKPEAMGVFHRQMYNLRFALRFAVRVTFDDRKEA